METSPAQERKSELRRQLSLRSLLVGMSLFGLSFGLFLKYGLEVVLAVLLVIAVTAFRFLRLQMVRGEMLGLLAGSIAAGALGIVAVPYCEDYLEHFARYDPARRDAWSATAGALAFAVAGLVVETRKGRAGLLRRVFLWTIVGRLCAVIFDPIYRVLLEDYDARTAVFASFLAGAVLGEIVAVANARPTGEDEEPQGLKPTTENARERA